MFLLKLHTSLQGPEPSATFPGLPPLTLMTGLYSCSVHFGQGGNWGENANQ